MTQENKQLLIKDLLGRLLYGIKFESYDNIPIVECCVCDKVFIHEQGYIIIELLDKDSNGNTLASTSINLTTVSHLPKPYLRPMSSMTEVEKKEFAELFYKWHDDELFDYIEEGIEFSIWKHKGISAVVFDWLNKKMFDYRGLIPMGLALEAPEDMYNTKTE